MVIDCKTVLGIMYLLIFILVIILAGITIKEGKSIKKMVSWTLYSFSIIFGLAVVAMLFLIKCDHNKPLLRFGVPILTGILCISNLVGMIISEPDLHISQLYTPHLINVLLFLGSIFIGYGVCPSIKSKNKSTESVEES